MIAPSLHPDSWVAPGAVIVGDVTLGPKASVWYGCVVRGDLEPIRIGERSNVQDLTCIHVDHGMPVTVGERVTIGHRCIVHGCEVGDDAMIGMGAVLLSGCRIGRGAVVSAGAVVREGFEVPDGQIAAGVPATLRGPVSEDLRRRFAKGVDSYVDTSVRFRAGEFGVAPEEAR